MELLLPAIISAVTSLFVAIVTHFLATRREARARIKREREKVNLEYLNPLRLYLVENYFRLQEILKRVDEGDGRCEALTYVTDAKDVSKQSAEWFNEEGSYLISSCYFTACLFYYVNKVREDIPYLRLVNRDDTRLLTLILKVNLGFLTNLGIFYAVQPSIGNDMYLRDGNRLISYREFGQSLQDSDKRVWFDRLLTFYIQAGQGVNLGRLKKTLAAIQELSEFLDDVVGGKASIEVRLEAEGIESM